MGYQLVGIATIFLFTSLIIFPAFKIMRKLHVLRADKAVEEIGFDVTDIYPGVSEEFLSAVRDKIEAKEEQEKKLHQFAEVDL
jgi:ammonia channel protein AmtB